MRRHQLSVFARGVLDGDDAVCFFTIDHGIGEHAHRTDDARRVPSSQRSADNENVAVDPSRGTRVTEPFTASTEPAT
jgi:hypothetical protein